MLSPDNGGKGNKVLTQATPWMNLDNARLSERTHKKTPGFLVSGGEEFNPGPETRLDCAELLCNKVLLKYKGDRESF